MKIMFVFLPLLIVTSNVSSTDCVSDIAECIGGPAPGASYDWIDPAIEPIVRDRGFSESDWGDELLRRAQSSSGAAAAKWWIELALRAAFKREKRRSSEYLERAAMDADGDSDVRRRLDWSHGYVCAAVGDFECALMHWHEAVVAAGGRPAWAPQAYALAMWGLGKSEKAIAWYSVAVRSDVMLGRSYHAANIGGRSKLNRVARQLFKAWSEIHAPFRSTVVVDVEIDVDGRLSRIQFEETEVAKHVLDRARLAMLDWTFDPLVQDGAPVALSTHLYVDFRGRRAGDAFNLEIQYAGMGMRSSGGSLHYPSMALRQGLEGTVLLDVSVGADGRVQGVEILQSSGHSVLDRSSANDVKKWIFEVDHFGSQPQSGTIVVPVQFQLGERGYERPSPYSIASRTSARNFGHPVGL